MKTILVIDDDERVGKAAARRLRLAGLSVWRVEDLETARALLGEETFDAVVTDLHMGHGNEGAQIVAACRGRPAPIPVLVMTGDPGGARRLGVPVVDKLDMGDQLVGAVEHLLAPAPEAA